MKRSWTDDAPRSPSKESRFATVGEGCQDDVPLIVVQSRTPTTKPSRLRSTTWTRRFALPLKTKRMTVEDVPMHIAGVVADDPAGSDSECLS